MREREREGGVAWIERRDEKKVRWGNEMTGKN